MEKDRKITWDIDVSILTNRFILGELFKVLSISVGVVAILFTILFLISGGGDYSSSTSRDFKYASIFILMFFALTVIFIFAYYSNRYSITYNVYENGADFITRKDQRKKNSIINGLLILLGLLTGNLGAMGTGLISRGSQDMTIKWRSVKKITVYNNKVTIALKGGYGVKFIIFCSEDVFLDVKDYILKKCPKAFLENK